jgi:hypothetical protein
MARSAYASGGASQNHAEERQRYEGSERVPLLPWARWVALAPSADSDAPVAVWIEWVPGLAEHPLPGSALWRAVLTTYLEREAPSSDAAFSAIRQAVETDLGRFPSLERWLDWRDRERQRPAGTDRPPEAHTLPSFIAGWWPWSSHR